MLAGVGKEKLAALLREWSKGRVSHRRAGEILDLVSSSLGAQDQKLSHLELVRCRIKESFEGISPFGKRDSFSEREIRGASRECWIQTLHHAKSRLYY